MGRKTQFRFHGAPHRFDVVAHFIGHYFGHSIQYIADVAGGQGMLTKLLNKWYNYEAEVIDLHGWRRKGAPGREEKFDSEMASYYDLVVGLHPDEATRAVAEAALVRPTIIVPCCNFWCDEKLGRDELVEAIEEFYDQHELAHRRILFPFSGPKNIGILSFPRNQSLIESGPDIDEVIHEIEKYLE